MWARPLSHRNDGRGVIQTTNGRLFLRHVLLAAAAAESADGRISAAPSQQPGIAAASNRPALQDETFQAPATLPPFVVKSFWISIARR
jgi:hypothetical protein